MSTEARYYRVGVFVLAGLALMVAALLVFGGRSLFDDPVTLETYFDESVQGLEVGSPVKLRGVRIGQVRWIGFADDVYAEHFESFESRSEASELVMVLMEITPPQDDDPFLRVDAAQRGRRVGALVERGLRLRLATAGFTGASFVQADYLDPQRHPPPEIAWKPRNLYVPSAPSTIATISSAAERVMHRLEDVEVEETVLRFNALLATLEEKVGAVDTEAITAGVGELVNDLGASVRRADLPGLSREARAVFSQIDATVARIQRLVDGGQLDLQLALENLRVTSENLRDLSDSVRSRPSLLIRGRAHAERGALE